VTERYDGAENWRYKHGGAGEYKPPTGRWPANVILECICDDPEPLPETTSDREGEETAEKRYTDEGSTNFAAKPGQRRTGGGFVHTNPECPGYMLDEQTGERPGCRSPSDATPKSKYRPNQGDYQPQGPIYPDTGGASRFFYCSKASRRERGEGTSHPTVKPIALMRYLIRLVARKDALILDPFIGSGTTVLAGLAEDVSVVGIDQSAEYIAMAQARIDARDV
jgi:site-specific DNA-methyltransferase (adenine-specific)